MLVVEDGTGLKNANSYIDVDFANEYLALRGVKIDDLEKNYFHLINGTLFLDTNYNFVGTKLNDTQSLKFPRLINGVNSLVPLPIKQASAILAFYSSINKIGLNQNEQRVIKSEQISQIKFEYENSKTQNNAFLEIDNLLKPFVNSDFAFNANLIRC